jgi:hypothetical protein
MVKLNKKKTQISNLINLLITNSITARELGLLAIRDDSAHDDTNWYLNGRSLYNLGLKLVTDGTDAADVERILRNLAKSKLRQFRFDKEFYSVIYEMIIAGVLAIQRGDNHRFMLLELVSLIPDRLFDVSMMPVGIEKEYRRYERRPVKYSFKGKYAQALFTARDTDIQRLMRDISCEDLCRLIYGFNYDFKNVFLSNMSRVAAENLELNSNEMNKNKEIYSQTNDFCTAVNAVFIDAKRLEIAGFEDYESVENPDEIVGMFKIQKEDL